MHTNSAKTLVTASSTIRILAIAVLLPLGTAHAETMPADKCAAGKISAAGKYSACVAKAEKVLIATGLTDKYADALSKCRTQMDGAFEKLEAAAAGECPSSGDDSSVRDFVDGCVEGLSDALSGGSLPPDPALCEASFASCNANLGGCNYNLGTCSYSLETCNTQLAFYAPYYPQYYSCLSTQSQCANSLNQCNNNLASANANATYYANLLNDSIVAHNACLTTQGELMNQLSQCTTSNSQCASSLGVCTTQYESLQEYTANLTIVWQECAAALDACL